LELSHLRALIGIGELANFRKAGEHLHLSPPAVFDQVRQLEQQVGQKLYERAGRKLVLTEAGVLLLSYARRILQEHDEALTALHELSGNQRGLLRFGCGPHISVAVVPHLLRAFLAKHPGIEVRLITGNDPSLFDDLRSNRVDLLLMNLPVDDAALEQIGLWRYELVFIAAPEHPVTDYPNDLAQQPFILYQRAFLIEEAIRRFCVEVGFEPKVVMQNDQADSIKELVKLGLGVSLLPLWSVSEDVRRGTLRIIRLPDRHLFSETGLIYRKSAHVSAAIRALVDVAHQWREWLPRAGDVQAIGEVGGGR
jgi:DNA-binding transcriptional LysR family regulator